MDPDSLRDFKAADQIRREQYRKFLDGNMEETELVNHVSLVNMLCNQYFEMLVELMGKVQCSKS
jgi:hypothetical protein